MPQFYITIAICTWNRSRSLGATLASIQRLKVSPDTRWDVLVVNNNCTDDTDAVLARFADCLPLSVTVEPRQGLSHARNRAVEATGGDYILWTDDDTVVDIGEFKVYMDAESAKWLKDATVDYVDQLQESGFKVDAPNAGISEATGPVVLLRTNMAIG